MTTIGQRLLREHQEAADAALDKVAAELLRMAEAELPVGDPAEDPDPAKALARSGYIRKIAPGVVEVGFHGPYAAKQHEAQTFKHPRGGKAKFLEDPLKAMIPELPRIVAGEVRARTKAR